VEVRSGASRHRCGSDLRSASPEHRFATASSGPASDVGETAMLAFTRLLL
jgi:hypothetical protein